MRMGMSSLRNSALCLCLSVCLSVCLLSPHSDVVRASWPYCQGELSGTSVTPQEPMLHGAPP